MREKFNIERSEEINFDEERELELSEIEKTTKGFKSFLEVLGARRINLLVVKGEKGETMSFNHQTNEVKVSINFLEEMGLNRDQIKFGLVHEIGHLIQLLEDPEGYLNTFDFVEGRAKDKSKDETEEEALKQIYHQFFNVFLDINDNQIVREKIVAYHKGEGSKEKVPQELYEEKLFPVREGEKIPDYRESPLYSQFLNYILRKNMTEKGAELSEEVKGVMGKKINVYGESITIEEFITKYIQRSEAKTGEILLLLKQFLLPVFEDLIEIDKKNQNLKVKKMSKFVEGGGIEEKKKIAKKVIEDIKESKKSSEERARDVSRKQFKKSLGEKGFTEREIGELLEIKESTEKEVENLATLWHSFTRILTEIKLERERRHKVGGKINIPDLILQYGRLIKNPKTVEAMERYLITTKEQILPKKIKIVLLLDLSGSMTREKRMEVKKNAYIIYTSLKRFEAENFYEVGEDFVKADISFVGYGSNATELPLTISEDETTNFYRSILDIDRDFGGTEDDKSLEVAREKFNNSDIDSIKKGELLGIVLQITDGETITEANSKIILEDINNSGVFCRGIQIPGDILEEMSQEDRKKIGREEIRQNLIPSSGTFKRLWNEKGLRIDNISQLRDVLSTLLEEAMEGFLSK